MTTVISKSIARNENLIIWSTCAYRTSHPIRDYCTLIFQVLIKIVAGYHEHMGNRGSKWKSQKYVPFL